METEDLLGRFLIEYNSGWFLSFRDNERMSDISKFSGYDVVELSQEPLGYHKFSVSTPATRP